MVYSSACLYEPVSPFTTIPISEQDGGELNLMLKTSDYAYNSLSNRHPAGSFTSRLQGYLLQNYDSFQFIALGIRDISRQRGRHLYLGCAGRFPWPTNSDADGCCLRSCYFGLSHFHFAGKRTWLPDSGRFHTGWDWVLQCAHHCICQHHSPGYMKKGVGLSIVHTYRRFIVISSMSRQYSY